ncbi:NAD(P)-dependent oxidoreductase [Verrucomicrobia bacterium SCGC AG-212-E04]|nr:NAD(P)-dependent oxidoreductase [Verrucomicrobia bacterium SCGC AG-212-E04]
MAQLQRDAKPVRPARTQRRRPGIESRMVPRPDFARRPIPRSGRFSGKVVIISGGDSGIGRAVAVAFAAEGAKVAILYLNEHGDARETRRLIRETGRECFILAGDVGHEAFCRRAIAEVMRRWGRIDILVNNAAEQHPQPSLVKITSAQLERTFRTNIFSQFFLAKAALRHLRRGAVIINTTSVTAYRGSAELLDYSATKGAIVAFTRSLAHSLVKRGVRVNGVAPGPIWTPLIPSTFPARKIKTFGTEVPLGRVGQPAEVAGCYVFLASEDAAYMTGQVLHPNGGEIVNG